MNKDYYTEDEWEEADIYFESKLAQLSDDEDLLSGAEEGFMTGYLAAF